MAVWNRTRWRTVNAQPIIARTTALGNSENLWLRRCGVGPVTPHLSLKRSQRERPNIPSEFYGIHLASRDSRPLISRTTFQPNSKPPEGTSVLEPMMLCSKIPRTFAPSPAQDDESSVGHAESSGLAGGGGAVMTRLRGRDQYSGRVRIAATVAERKFRECSPPFGRLFQRVPANSPNRLMRIYALWPPPPGFG